MALSNEQKRLIFDLLAAGKSATEAAKTAGCSRSSVERLKRDSKNDPVVSVVQTQAVINQVSEHGNVALDRLSELKKREEQALDSNIQMLLKLRSKTMQLIETADVEELSPRQIPALVKACGELDQVVMNLGDRLAGVDVLADFYQHFEERALR